MTAPTDLASLPGWLIWRYEAGEKKPRKVPYYARGGRRAGEQGSDEDRDQLVDFIVARSAAAAKRYDGVGLALMPEFGIVALDFDNVVDEAGVVLPEVLALCQTTYAEISPSGRGVRAFFRGDLGNRKSHGAPFGFETFSSKGFVTFTGNVLPIVELLGNEDTIAPVDDLVLAMCEARFKRALPAPAAHEGEVVGLTPEQIGEALARLDPGMGHDDWLRVGMALHHETRGEGFDLWDTWSAGGASYPDSDTLRGRWASFGKGQGGVTARSLLQMAGLGGGLPAAVDEFEVVERVPGAPAELDLPPFTRDKSGRIEPDVANVVLALQREDICGTRVGIDLFTEDMMIGDGQGGWRRFDDADYVALRIRLGTQGFKPVGRDAMKDAVLLVAKQCAFDSAIEWAEALRWDGVPRIETFWSDYFGVPDTPYTRAVGLYTWTGLAGRALEPGVKCDMVPVLIGLQGAGKTTAVEAMSPREAMFVELNLERKDDDLARGLRGKLVGELAELRGLQGREAEAIKAWITRRHEEWVPKYREFATRYGRRCLFIGTGNREGFLDDETGERRWLPMTVGDVDVPGVKAVRDQLWAEGAAMFKASGVAWQDAYRLAKDQHREFKVADVWDEVVADWLERDDFEGPRAADGVRLIDVLVGALGFQAQRIGRKEEVRVGKVLRRLGFHKRVRPVDGVPLKVWMKEAADVCDLV